jgi:MFS family permease
MATTNINWHRIYAITALNSAILICWMAYHFFQPKLLAQFGLESASQNLLLAQAFILVLIPPLSGYLADRFSKQLGNNYLLFTVGISFTALIFFASAYVFLDMAPESLKAMIPFFMVLWLIGMNIFYAPSTGFILNSVKTAELPIAIAFITVSLNLLFAVMDYLLMFLEYAGSSLTFIVGGVLLIVSAIYYYRVAHKTEDIEMPTQNFKTNLLLTLWVGLLTGVLKHWGLVYLPGAIDPFFGGFHISIVIFIAAALLAFPLCYQLIKYTMLYSF